VSKGATYPSSLAQISGGAAVPAPLLGDSDQLRLRYDAPTNTYEIQLPQTQSWLAIAPVAGSPGDWAGSGVTLKTSGGDSSAILSWSASNSFGVTAVGIPTNPANVQFSVARYIGSLEGYSSETFANSPGLIGGNVSLTFVFGSSSLTGTIVPTLTLGQTYTLPTLNFTDTVHAAGTTSFSGRFDTALPGANSFSGTLVGVTGRRVIGNFAFPYSSPVNGASRQAAGAFTGAALTTCC